MYLRFILIALVLAILPIDVANAVAPGGFVPCDGVDCSLCSLVAMINVIIIWLFGIIFITFGIIALVAGFGLVTSRGNQVALDAAKTKLSNAIIGLIIVMAAWLLIDTIMRGLMDGGNGEIRGWGPWTDVQCQVQIVPLEGAAGGADGEGAPGMGGGVSGPPLGAGQLSHQDALGVLSANGVPPPSSSGGCTDRTNRNCTSLDGINQDTLNRTVGTINDCNGCNLRITAGTEVGHRNTCHTNGTCVDINCGGGCSTGQINNVLSSAGNNGSRAVYEVRTPARKNQLVAAGVPASSIEVVEWISAEHFSLYTN